MGKLNKILPIPRGEFNINNTYYYLDWVKFGNGIWVCKKDEIKGIQPTEGENWMFLVRDGVDGGGASIDDNNSTTYSTYSSSKINQLVENVDIDVDDALSTTSENPVQNKVVTTKINEITNDVSGLQTGKANTSHTHTKSNITDFAHTHTKSDITDFSHSHAISDITDLQTTITGLAERISTLEAKFTNNDIVKASLSGTTLTLTKV